MHRESVGRPVTTECCICGCHGAAPRPQFAPTPAALATLEADRARLRGLATKLTAKLLEAVTWIAEGSYRKAFVEYLNEDPEVRAELDEITADSRPLV